MSAAPVYPRSPRPTRTNSSTQTRRTRKATQANSALSQFATSCVVFTAVAVVTFGFSTLLGHSMKEGARRTAIRSQERAKIARADVSRIRGRFERLTTMRAVDEWSKFNGYESGYQFVKAPTAKPVVPSKPVVAARHPKNVQIDVLVAKVNDAQIR